MPLFLKWPEICHSYARPVFYYWLRQDDVFTENWIFIDLVELFDPMNYNLFEHARSLQSQSPDNAFA
jgi:hypothetical protein